jgi:hypothetical protein
MADYEYRKLPDTFHCLSDTGKWGFYLSDGLPDRGRKRDVSAEYKRESSTNKGF